MKLLKKFRSNRDTFLVIKFVAFGPRASNDTHKCVPLYFRVFPKKLYHLRGLKKKVYHLVWLFDAVWTWMVPSFVKRTSTDAFSLIFQPSTLPPMALVVKQCFLHCRDTNAE